MRYRFYFGLLLIFFLVNTNLFAQNFWVPDSNLRKALKQVCPICFSQQDSLITVIAANTVFTLGVSNQHIKDLSGVEFFTSITKFDCSSNEITNLPVLPPLLKEFRCGNNPGITNLPALPAGLTVLTCGATSITTLPPLPAGLIDLGCFSTSITNLPLLPAGLISLHCGDNNLTVIPTLPAGLKYLSLNGIALNVLPQLPATLVQLDISNTNISVIDSLPPNLKNFNCASNTISILPELPLGLEYLDCWENTILHLPKLPPSMLYLNCSNNPISCLPYLGPDFVEAFFSNTYISCIPNIPNNFFYPSFFPLCSANQSTCFYSQIQGYVFNDINGNGVLDTLENGIRIAVKFNGNNLVQTDSTGFFNAVGDTGITIVQVNVPQYFTATTPTIQTVNLTSGINTIYFGFQPIPNVKDLIVNTTLCSPLRPGFKVLSQINYKNNGTVPQSNISIKYIKPSQLSTLFAIPAASNIIGDTLVWNVNQLLPLEEGFIKVLDSVSSATNIGTILNIKTSIEPIVGDSSPLNNQVILARTVIGSFDPNDKSVNTEFISPNQTDFLEYNIRFQNTGTDTAFAILITDSLSSNLDAESLELISSSHPSSFILNNGIAKWFFTSIQLPDSNVNEIASHGFIKFRIKPKANLNAGTQIPNTANIYFDYNSALTTNTIVVNVLNPLQVKELKETALQIFPNPVKDILNIVNQHIAALGKIELINARGKVLETKTISTSTYTWNLQHLPAGTYILRGQGWGQKVVKE
ncbi:MAG TPA: T9SS type A sorting domain-containing protein [Bacteroidia bacterium]|nr:T9SS type A sorting domain-containing protein [Bacteroidia bacterium]